jgi:hypothetical protein
MRDPRTPLERRAKRAEDSGRKAAAGWLGHRAVATRVTALRPSFQTLVAQLGLAEEEINEAALHLMGGRMVHPNGEESANPFASWPEERLEPARYLAGAVRWLVATVTAQLRELKVPMAPVIDDPYYADHHGFSADHFYLALLLWRDVPLDGRSGAEIAADLPALPTASWEDQSDAVRVSDHASEQDLRDVFALRAAWRTAHGARRLPKPYAGGGRRRSGQEPGRDARRAALAEVLQIHPGVSAGRLRATWGGSPSTPGGRLRSRLGLQPWDDPPGESTLRADLAALRR